MPNRADYRGALLEKFGKGRGMGFEHFPPESFGGEVYRSPNLPPPTRYVPTPQEGAASPLASAIVAPPPPPPSSFPEFQL